MTGIVGDMGSVEQEELQEEIARAQGGVRAWVERSSWDGSHDLRKPSAPILASALCAAAIAPLVAVSSDVSDLGTAAVADIEVLASVDGNVLRGVITLVANRLYPGKKQDASRLSLGIQKTDDSKDIGETAENRTTEGQAEAEIAREIALILAAHDANTQPLTIEIARLLAKIDAGGTILRSVIETSNDRVRSEIIAAVGVLVAGFHELGFLFTDVTHAAEQVQASMDKQSILTREILEQQQRQFVEIRRMRQDLAGISEQPDLLFRIYVPTERLYAAEANRLLSLFRDWLVATGMPGVRQSGYRTPVGEMYEFFAESSAASLNLSEQFGHFSSFLALCDSTPSAAAHMLAEQGIKLPDNSDLVARFGREVRRLQIDLRHERERRILAIRHTLEEELTEEGVDLAGTFGNQLNALLEYFVPDASASASLALLPVRHSGSLASSLTVNINSQIVNAAKSTIIHNVQGTINLGPEVAQLLELIERFSGPDCSNLKTAVYELEDSAAPPSARVKAKDRLIRFLYDVGTVTKNVGVDVLEKYVEHKLGLSG